MGGDCGNAHCGPAGYPAAAPLHQSSTAGACHTQRRSQGGSGKGDWSSGEPRPSPLRRATPIGALGRCAGPCGGGRAAKQWQDGAECTTGSPASPGYDTDCSGWTTGSEPTGCSRVVDWPVDSAGAESAAYHCGGDATGATSGGSANGPGHQPTSGPSGYCVPRAGGVFGKRREVGPLLGWPGKLQLRRVGESVESGRAGARDAARLRLGSARRRAGFGGLREGGGGREFSGCGPTPSSGGGSLGDGE